MGSLPSDKQLILNFLADQFRGYSDLAWPDRTKGGAKEIDATITYEGRAIAVEHTRVLRFLQEPASQVQFQEIVDDLRKSVQIRPNGRLTVFLPCRDFGGKAARRRIVSELTKGLMSDVSLMCDKGQKDIPMKGVSFKAFIDLDPGLPSEVVYQQFAPSDILGHHRPDTQLRKKVSKLLPYKKRGFVTLLLIETLYRDSNPNEIVRPIFVEERALGIQLDELWETWPDVKREYSYCQYDLPSYREKWAL